MRTIPMLVLALACTAACAINPADRRTIEWHDADGVWRGRGICYSPFRDGQSPDGAQPSKEQILEDLLILDPHFDLIRSYGSGANERAAAEHIREQGLGLKMILGAWIAPEAVRDEEGAYGEPIPANIAANAEQVANAISIANDFPDVVIALVIGNESQIYWSGHLTRAEVLAGHIRSVRDAVEQPVSTADVFDWWYTPESQLIADECDFIGLHAYAMWNGRQLDEAMSWTREQIDLVRAQHPGVPIVINELGWATSVWPDGEEAKYIAGEPGEAQQELFYRAWRNWAEAQQMPYTYFQAFDENWKNPEHPDAVENHWGLWRADRSPKLAIESGPAISPGRE